MDSWKDAIMEGWKDGRMEGRMEGWKERRMIAARTATQWFPHFLFGQSHHSAQEQKLALATARPAYVAY